ncbi:cell division cycle protein 123 homolog [Copidosoma floridanum]|uniref:cell division cycle protein 123 homolog n=1 Tax=Copidosoma floridanum TaxID=29053 RepID=UPI0006C98D09|nr:cell division cycle protein 123 homolog [Copidosoma floridanum]
MKIKGARTACSFCQWYPLFSKNAVEAVILSLPDDVLKYVEHDAFLLPVEAASNVNLAKDSEWSDGSAICNDEVDEDVTVQPTFPDFSKQIQEVIDDFGAVFIKTNWSTPSDAAWMLSTKTLKCCSLEDVYLLLKGSDRISRDLSFVSSCDDQTENLLKPCLILKKWRDIDPCSEFRCFVINQELVGICQRDTSQYYKHIETEKYDIQRDIKSLFTEKIKNNFSLRDYTFDVIRIKKDKVKILDFGLLDKSATERTLFTLEELHSDIREKPEFRFIAEDMGIQPTKYSGHVCVPQEINEFFQSMGGMSVIEALRKEVEEQEKEGDSDDE